MAGHSEHPLGGRLGWLRVGRASGLPFLAPPGEFTRHLDRMRPAKDRVQMADDPPGGGGKR